MLRAKGLKPKGKNGDFSILKNPKDYFSREYFAFFPGTNDAFVTMALGKEKFQTTVVEQAASDVEWREQADL